MSQIVDRKTASALMEKCRAALNEVLAQEGFEVSKVSAKFGDSFGLSISAIPSVKNEFGLNPNSEEVLDFNRYHELFKIQPDALGVQFAVSGKQYTFEGLKMSRRKFPIAAATADGKKMVLKDDPRVVEAINQAATLRAGMPAGAPAKPAKPKG